MSSPGFLYLLHTIVLSEGAPPHPVYRWCGRPEITKALKGDMPVVRSAHTHYGTLGFPISMGHQVQNPQLALSLLRYPRKSNKLVHLPEDYSALLNQACHFQ